MVFTCSFITLSRCCSLKKQRVWCSTPHKFTLLSWVFATSYATGQNFPNTKISLNFKLQNKGQHNRSIINNVLLIILWNNIIIVHYCSTFCPGHHMVVRNSWTEFRTGFDGPVLSTTPENKTRGLCMGKSCSHVWSVPFFQYFFSLTVIFLLIYLNQSLLISRPKTIP